MYMLMFFKNLNSYLNKKSRKDVHALDVEVDICAEHRIVKGGLACLDDDFTTVRFKITGNQVN